jgi:hypothetical protein
MKSGIGLGGFVILILVVIIGCKKKEEKLPPTINFKVGSTYTKDSAIVAVGHKLYFGIQARGISENLTNFTIKKILEDGTSVTVMDTGMNAESLDLDKTFYQNVENKATWTFTVMDKNRSSASVSLRIYKDPNSAYGGIYYFPSVLIGYQNNTYIGHFMDAKTGMVYNEDSATVHQADVDFLIYYFISDDLPSPVLSSPGEMDNFSTDAQLYYPCIINWLTRKYTKWDISIDNGTNTPLTVADFDAAQNDSLLIVAYHDVWGKKKFRWATAGKIIPFMTSDGKKGLVKVISADFTDTGSMEIAVKIQQ